MPSDEEGDDPLDYGRLMQRAMRSVVREALGVVAELGLPEGHHFYIAYDTRHPGVDMPAWLRERYPEEITIVLQHEFWDLAVAPDRFSVSLSFSGRAAPLTVPFDAVLTFVDPDAEFGLKFDPVDPDAAEEPAAGDGPVLEPAGKGPEDDDGPEPPEGGGRVVSLDRFRKS